MVEQIDVEFGVEGNATLRGWLFVPDMPGRRPAITMAHGYAGIREHGLDRFARVFADAGFVVLVHDHRGFGVSDGLPRFDVDPWRQVADWRYAISYLESHPGVDADRIGLWGTSYAGGHALVLGATDRRLKAVVAQVPTISGFQQGLRRVAPDQVAGLEASFIDDDRRQFAGKPPATQLVVSPDPGTPAAYHSPEAVAFYSQPVPEGGALGEPSHRALRSRRAHVRTGAMGFAGVPHTPADDHRAHRHHHPHRHRAGRLRTGPAAQKARDDRRRSLRRLPALLRAVQRRGPGLVRRAPGR